VAAAATLEETGDEVTFEKYVDDQFGFLRLVLADGYLVGKYFTTPKYPAPQAPGTLVDTFRLDWKKDKKLA